jgi:hypothetical protein
MILHLYTILHVIISLLAIASGFAVLKGWLNRKLTPPWVNFFLVMTALTSVTGFFFPFHGFTPAIGFGIVLMIVLAFAAYALTAKKLEGGWRTTFVVNSLIALYLNTFVLVVQLFLKVPFLKTIAPTQASPPFGIAQGLVFVIFLILSIRAVRRIRASALVAV